MKSLKTLMYSGIKYFFCLLYTNSLCMSVLQMPRPLAD